MKKSLFLASATLFALTVSASAQQRGNGFGNQNGAGNRAGAGQAGGGALRLPDNIRRVVSIDAYNMLLAEVDNNGKTEYAPIIIRHVYSGGIAKLFGGTSIPTEQFVSPGASASASGARGLGGSSFGNNGNQGQGGQGFGGNQGFGGTQGFGGNQGFGGTQGFGGNQGFGGTQGFGSNQGFGGNVGSFLMTPTAGGRN